MRSYAFYFAAAFAEIAGSFAFWAWLRLGKSALWLVPGVALLALFAFLLTRVDAAFAGRAYAAYGGVYIASSLVWLWMYEGSSGPLGPRRCNDLHAGCGAHPVWTKAGCLSAK